jgi:hypothetical protein
MQDLITKRKINIIETEYITALLIILNYQAMKKAFKCK